MKYYKEGTMAQMSTEDQPAEVNMVVPTATGWRRNLHLSINSLVGNVHEILKESYDWISKHKQ